MKKLPSETRTYTNNIEDINLNFKDLQDLNRVYTVEKTKAVSIAKIHIQIHQTVKPRDEKNQHIKSEVGHMFHKSSRVYTDLNKLYMK